MTRSLSFVQALMLGLAVALGLGLGGFGVFAIGQKQLLWSDALHLEAGFRQIQGVEVGTRVRVLGRDAGEVEEVQLPSQPSGLVVLRLRIDAKIRQLLRADAAASIVAEGMVGGKVVEIHPGTDSAPPVENGAAIATKTHPELKDMLGEMRATLNGLKEGQGSIGKLMKEDDAYQEMLDLLKQSKSTMASLKQNSDALKSMPIVRSYVTDLNKELVRPDCETERRWLVEADVFEPNYAIFSSDGRGRLDDIALWLNGIKAKGSEIVVVSYAAENHQPDQAKTLTKMQAERVCEYLTSQHGVHKLGWIARRTVKPIGAGVELAPTSEEQKLPRPRIEVILFQPQK